MNFKYFVPAEFEYSETAKQLGINNKIPNCLWLNLQNLVLTVLDPAREQLGCPIRVNSGYRSFELNKAVKGAKNSYHMQARAADIAPIAYRNTSEEWQNKLDRLYDILQQLPHTELIRYPNFIHVAL